MTAPIRRDQNASSNELRPTPSPGASANDGPPPPERRRRNVGWRSRDILRTSALVIAMYLTVRLVWFANPLFLTAFLGLLFGLAVSSGVDRLEGWRIPRGIGAALVVVTFIGLLAGFGAWVAPTIRAQTVELRERLPESIDRLELWIKRHNAGLIGSVLAPVSASAHEDSAQAAGAGSSPAAAGAKSGAGSDTSHTSPLRDRISKQVAGASRYFFPFLSSTLQVLSGLLLIIFLSVYIGADPELYHRGLMQLFPRRARSRAGEVLSAIANALRRWLVTQLIAMLVIGVVTSIALLILHVRAPFALGVLAGLFEFIPTVGPILSSLPAIAMGFLDSPEKALYVVIAFVGIQFAENHLLIPLLMKGGVDAPPALTILSQALMAILFGFLGLMCAVPLLAATLVAVKMLYVEGVVGDVAATNKDRAKDASPA